MACINYSNDFNRNDRSFKFDLHSRVFFKGLAAGHPFFSIEKIYQGEIIEKRLRQYLIRGLPQTEIEYILEAGPKRIRAIIDEQQLARFASDLFDQSVEYLPDVK